MLDGTEFFECACYSPEHTLRFILSLDADDPGIHTEVHLGNYPWGWKRVWVGIRYIFGYKSKFGAWDCFLLQPEDVPRLRALLDRFPVSQGCTRPPKGWFCTRTPEHDGPCAAYMGPK